MEALLRFESATLLHSGKLGKPFCPHDMSHPEPPNKHSVNQQTDRFAEAPLADVPGFDQVLGQGACVERLRTFGRLYRERNAVPEHILLTGNEGNGKQMMLRAFAKVFNTGLRQCDAKQFRQKGELTAILTSVESGEAILITNLQELRKPIREVLEEALEHFRINLIIGLQDRTRLHPFDLPRFTLLATAPRPAEVPAELVESFALSLTLEPYSNEELEAITVSLASRVGLTLGSGVATLVVRASQRTPSSIDQLLRKFSRLGKTTITETEANEVLAAFGLASGTVGTAVSAASLDKLSGVEFERLITSLLQRMGFQAEMTTATGDGGIDIVASLDKAIIGGRYLIQCKRFESLVGAPVIREFYGAVVADRRATKGILITTSGFTDQARQFADSLPLELIDRNRLEKLLAEFN